MTEALRREQAARFAAELGVDGEALFRGATAAWSNMNPQTVLFDQALSVAGATLVAAAQQRRAAGGELARLVEQVLARDDAREALEFVLASDGPPSCGCGADHWACPDGE